ncbi:hypothetical protein GCM10007860_23410 [Chitiniphilus shinanonensis]|uniref:HTH marR-type domain-containing protein n=2 Tax=Chitiniphilus shinanonensis TaxID=553088 RepID=A0ABQ6BV17_9NEIS|nr:hypothetical protein GCM10007860_23410 [Chitiniphilus shinanonensis]
MEDNTMPRTTFLPVVRELARCYQAFERLSGRHIRQLGLTAGQFDVIATLGGTDGMSCRELGDATLITKGTLTGVLDRLAERGLIERCACSGDRRSITVRLTPAGQALFDNSFDAHLAHLKPAFDQLAPDELAETAALLARLREALENEAPDCCEIQNN